MAEYILKRKCREQNLDWEIASTGTENYHVGKSADERGIRTALNYGTDMRVHKARQLTPKDFDYYDIIYSMATDVTHEMAFIANRESRMKKVKLFMDELFPGKLQSVPDPWYGNEKDFIPVYELVERGCEVIIKSNSTEKEL